MKKVTLGEVCKFQTGFWFKPTKYKKSGFPILRIKNIQQGKIYFKNIVFFDPLDYEKNLNKYKIKSNDIVIALSGATAGKIAFNNSDQILFLNTATGRIDPDETRINRRYLYHFLLSKNKELYEMAICGTQPNLYFSSIKNMEIILPSLSEQNRTEQQRY
ncbi:hypothetical protein A6V39_05290 [Candidatus Mycoplasma haematobovis]|uniref:Type I restriction modification DNA specificity domain-containing protein n=1 Tax=Candidatus Mycoplasma haematobovis TaxID=432608 RepID=A0A1A9QDI1_9MOLU|nr:restriction endonuclease subunit S [Candidatus Mycoplasma haematobovis]OAL09749.1 hypothetical protein A6V39_05290 [Candidatus Mycoplasma haematobovis]